MRDDDPTPRESSSHQRAPIFARIAGVWAEACKNESLKYTKNLGIMDLQRARECTSLERKFRALEDSFHSWVRGDRDPDMRISDTIELQDLEAAALELKVPCEIAASVRRRT